MRPVGSAYQLEQPMSRPCPPSARRCSVVSSRRPRAARTHGPRARRARSASSTYATGTRSCRPSSCARGPCSGRAVEQVREARRRRAEWALRSAVPDVAQGSRRHGRGSASRRRMSVTSKPVPRIRASTWRSTPAASTTELRRTSRMPFGDQLDVRLAERRIPAVGGQNALATQRVVGGDLAEQLRVRDLVAHVAPGDRLTELHQPRALDEAEHGQLASGVDPSPHQL